MNKELKQWMIASIITAVGSLLFGYKLFFIISISVLLLLLIVWGIMHMYLKYLDRKDLKWEYLGNDK